MAIYGMVSLPALLAEAPHIPYKLQLSLESCDCFFFLLISVVCSMYIWVGVGYKDVQKRTDGLETFGCYVPSDGGLIFSKGVFVGGLVMTQWPWSLCSQLWEISLRERLWVCHWGSIWTEYSGMGINTLIVRPRQVAISWLLYASLEI